MRFTAEQKATIRVYAAVKPIPQKKVLETSAMYESRLRTWTQGVAEQFCFSYGSAWGCKKASQTRPQSKDSIALIDGAVIWGFDLLIGSGTGKPTLAPDPTAVDISQQVFIVVAPKDTIGATPPGPTPPGPTPTPPCKNPVDYSQFVNVEAAEVREAYVAKHGREPGASDYYHNAWRRLSCEKWTHEAILRDI